MLHAYEFFSIDLSRKIGFPIHNVDINISVASAWRTVIFSSVVSTKLISFALTQTTSGRLADMKSAKFQKNITKRGSVPEATVKKGNDYPVGPMVLGFFIFVVIGSCKLCP
jgi:hypothetical protein